MEPPQHISLMMASEYMTVPQTQLIKAMKKYTNVQYEITDMEVIPHTEKTGRKFYLVVLRMKCDEVQNIRKMLNLKERSDMRRHITLLGKKLVERIYSKSYVITTVFSTNSFDKLS